jgi:hypothetical protein
MVTGCAGSASRGRDKSLFENARDWRFNWLASAAGIFTVIAFVAGMGVFEAEFWCRHLGLFCLLSIPPQADTTVNPGQLCRADDQLVCYEFPKNSRGSLQQNEFCSQSRKK